MFKTKLPPVIAFLMLTTLASSAGSQEQSAAQEDRSRRRLTEVPVSGPLCGHMCLKVTIGLLGGKVRMREIEADIPNHRKGASIRDLVLAARKYGLSAEGFRCSARQLHGLYGNADDILIVRVRKVVEGLFMNHYDLLIKLDSDRFLLVDPFGKNVIHDSGSLAESYLGDGLRISRLARAPAFPWLWLVVALGSGYLGACVFVNLQERFNRKFGGFLLLNASSERKG